MFQTNSNLVRDFGFSEFDIYFASVCFGFRASNFGFALIWLRVYIGFRYSDFEF